MLFIYKALTGFHADPRLIGKYDSVNGLIGLGSPFSQGLWLSPGHPATAFQPSNRSVYQLHRLGHFQYPRGSVPSTRSWGERLQAGSHVNLHQGTAPVEIRPHPDVIDVSGSRRFQFDAAIEPPELLPPIYEALPAHRLVGDAGGDYVSPDWRKRAISNL